MKNIFDGFDPLGFGIFGGGNVELRHIVKCPTCGQKNRLAPNQTTIKAGPHGPKCGRCKNPLVLL